LNNKLSVYIGIDPGSREAAIGIIRADTGQFMDYTRLSQWTPNEANEALILAKQSFNVERVAIEKVGVMKGQGISSSGKFMKATGVLIGLVVAHQFSFVQVTPQKWKKISPNLICPKCTPTEKKRLSLAYAQQRFPEAHLVTQVQHNIADALGIADWLYITYGRTQ
jgi:hypothetical protein